jgi:hypothetical protein
MTTSTGSTGATGLTFLSWYRTGLSAAVTAPTGTPLDTAPPAEVLVPVKAVISDPDNPGDTTGGDAATGSVQVRLHAPGDVTGLDPNQIIRTYPTDGATNVEPDCFPLIEFARPDVPWMLSPTGPQANQPTDSDPRRGLLPWLCLVVVPEPPATLSPPAQPGALSTLTALSSAFPDPSQLWLWAHAQVTTLSTDNPAQTIPDLLSAQPERGLSRLMAPLYLRPFTSYLACVVPAFDTTASTSGAAATLPPAWQLSDPPTPATLPVYYYWRFTTGPAGDFRSLVLELQHWTHGGVGIRPLDVGKAGTGMPSPASGKPPWLISLEGALVSDDVALKIGSWTNPKDPRDPTGQTAIQRALATGLDGTADELTPPVYGSTQASFTGQLSSPPDQGPTWLNTLNLDPRYRAAASLAASLVRANQDALILSAWDQAGQISSANLVLRQGQLARELGVSNYARRIGAAGAASPPMDDDRLLQLTSAIQSQVRMPETPGAPGVPETTVADAVAANPALPAVLSVPFRRTAPPTGPLASRLAAAPLPAPVTSLAKPGGIAPTPPLSPVSGLVDLASVSGNAETLKGLTEARVSQPHFPWEGAGIPAPRPPGAPADPLLQPGYLADLWVVGSGLGGALDWDGSSLAGWTSPPAIQANDPFTPGPAITAGGEVSTLFGQSGFNASAIGGAAALVNWNIAGTSTEPALVVITASIDGGTNPVGAGGTMFYIDMSVGCSLVGDSIPGVQDSPVVPTGPSYAPWPTAGVASTQLMAGQLGEGQVFPALTIAPAVSAGDLTGSGKPSLAVVWSLSATEYRGVYAMLFVDVDVALGAAQILNLGQLTALSPDVHGALLANRRLYVLAGGQLMSAQAGAAGLTLPFTANSMHPPNQPPEDAAWTAIAAADFTGSGVADLLLMRALPVPGPEGVAYRAVYQIGYEPDADGDPTYWSDEVEAPIPVTDLPTSLVLGPLDSGTEALQQTTTKAFRKAAAATQARMTSVIPAQASPPPPPPVDTGGLAAAVRAAVDPQVTVPASVTGRLSLPAPPSTAGGDELQPIAFTPQFPQPFYETVTESALSRLIPGLSAFPDEAITALSTDTHTVEALLIGANHEFSRELLWHGVPALLSGTFFARFWDGRDATGNPLADITDISSWSADSDLGTHAATTAASGGETVLLIRGELVRRFPHATIYAAPAVAAGTSRTVDVTQRIDPMFSGTLGGDSVFIGFPFPVQQAMSSKTTLGMYFVFQEHPMAPRFGLDLDTVTPTTFGQAPSNWSELLWSQTVKDATAFDALTYLDADSASPLWGVSLTDTGASGAPEHRWGFSAAHMAHICYRPPVLIAIHADELLATTAGKSG